MNTIRNELISRLNFLDPEQLLKVMNSFDIVAANYDFVEKSREVAIYTDINDKAIKLYLATLKMEGKSDKTIKAYLDCLTRFFATIGIFYENVRTNHIRYYLATMTEKGLKATTIENNRSYICTFFKWLNDEQMIQFNPGAAIKPVKIPLEIKESFTDQEVELLRSSCKNSRERLIIELLLSTGIRREEFINIKLDDINKKENSILITGKGNKQRFVYFDSITEMYLDKYLEEYDQREYLIYSVSNNQHGSKLNIKSLNSFLKALGKRAGVEDTHPHKFRHTFATNMLRKGMPIEKVSKLMGHASIQQTLEYATINQNDLKNAYDRYN